MDQRGGGGLDALVMRRGRRGSALGERVADLRVERVVR
jgi:hypothetical protein